MLNKLHGQPDSYDRKFVNPCPAHTIAMLRLHPQVAIPLRKDAGSRHIWNRPRGRLSRGQGRGQDHLEEERPRKRADGLRRAGDAATHEAPAHCQVPRLVRVKGTRISSNDCCIEALTAPRTNITSSHNWRPAESCSIASAKRANSPKRTRPRQFDKSSRQSTTSTRTTLCTEVSRVLPYYLVC
jgi:hypothetical protein